jgi:hypothetical protein
MNLRCASRRLKGAEQVFRPGWSGITPDGSALFTRDLSVQEIYALDQDLP